MMTSTTPSGKLTMTVRTVIGELEAEQRAMRRLAVAAIVVACVLAAVVLALVLRTHDSISPTDVVALRTALCASPIVPNQTTATTARWHMRNAAYDLQAGTPHYDEQAASWELHVAYCTLVRTNPAKMR